MRYRSNDKTIKIPIRIVNGQVKYLYGGDLPDIYDISVGELIIPEHSVKDKRFIEISQMSKEKLIAKDGTRLMFEINNGNIPEDKRVGIISQLYTTKITSSSFSYVKAILQEDLMIQLRGSKKPNLLDAKCKIPSLDREATSVNNAYTIISEEYEVNRKSHTGNVFNKCYIENGYSWSLLEDIRKNIEIELEENLFLDYKVFRLSREIINCTDQQIRLLIDHLMKYGEITGNQIKALYKNDTYEYVSIVNDLLDSEIICEIDGR